jgi:class 3 adenylate cyclase
VDALRRKSLRDPDQRVALPGVTEDYVEIGGYTVARSVQEPGWRYSRNDPRAADDGGWCSAHHVGVVISGRWGAELRDGTRLEWGPDDVFDCPPDHDGYTVGDEPCVMIEWGGVRTFIGSRGPLDDRVLATILFTDVVDSTRVAARIGDLAWRERLTELFRATDDQIERFGGRRVDTTGDGVLATFDAPVRAVGCAVAVRDAANAAALDVRIGVHVGEITLTSEGARGVALHEAARIMAEAGAAEIIVSELVRALVMPTGLRFEELDVRRLKGLSGEYRLFRYVSGR